MEGGKERKREEEKRKTSGQACVRTRRENSFLQDVEEKP